jgi:hypothetical protein
MFKRASFIIILIIFVVAEEAITMQQAIAKVYGNEKFGYTVSYPDHWYPSRLRYTNEFEIRNYVSEDPLVPARNRALLRIVDKVNESAEVTDRFLDSLVVGQNIPKQERQTLAIDGHRAVRVRGKLVYPTGSSIDTPTFYLAISTYIADEKHMLSLEASAPVDVDESVIQEIIKIEESVKFNKGG